MNSDFEAIYKWLDDLPITRQKRNINRDFSDAVPLAEVLKHFYPKLVEMHNYTPRNSFSQKMVNWEILNKRVLHKLKVTLSNEEMEQLAKGIPGAIEKLLVDIKKKIDSRAAEGDRCSTDNIYLIEELSKSPEGKIIPIKVKSGSKITEQKIVPSDVYDKMQSDLAANEETIKSLQSKVEHLESMIQMKNTRIEDLTKQLESIMNEPTNSVGSPKSRFFSRMFF